MTDWQAIIDRHGAAVWQTVSRMVGNETDAADCFQETFLAAVALARIKRVLSWSATLRAIAANKAADCLRRRYRRRARGETDATAEAPDRRSSGPSDRAVERELGAALRRALAAIDSRQAEVFCLVCLESMTYQEAADAMEVKPNHVGVLLNRARTALRERLRAFAPQGADHLSGGQSHVR